MMLNKSDIPKYTTLELALLTLLGYCANGQERVSLLGTRYDKVQDLVNKLLKGVYPSPSNLDINILEKTKEALMELKPSERDYESYVNDIIEYLKGRDIE